jgi:hypothetical protein
MKTGYNDLDKIINIQMPNMIAITGSTQHFRATLSGDIANNICICQEIEVFEVVSTFKEYLIKRIFTNFCDVNYHKWTLKNEYESEKYSNLELQKIALKTLDLIETNKRLPVIVEERTLQYNKNKILNLLESYANDNADGIEYDGKNKKSIKRDLKDDKYILRKARRICKKLKCPTVFTISKDVLNENMLKYFDYIIDLKEDDKNGIFYIEIKNKNILGNIKLKYNYEKRRFENYEKGEKDGKYSYSKKLS